MKIQICTITNDPMRLDMVLRKSEIEGQIFTFYNPPSATRGLNRLLERCEANGADVAVLAHHDMYFRQGWLPQVREQLAALPESWVIAGPIGKDMQGAIAGKLHDMRVPLLFNTSDIHQFPVAASCFDECCMLVNLAKGFRFDETLQGFDLYGTLAVCQAWEMGGTAWVIDAFCEHYCLRPFDWFPGKDFEETFRWLHRRFPLAPRIDTTVIGVPREQSPARYDRTEQALGELIGAAEEEAAGRR